MSLDTVDLVAVSESVRAKLQRPLPGWMRPLCLATAAIGWITFLVLVFAGDAGRAWRAYHVNWLYWTGIAQAGVLFAAVVTVAKGRWATPLRRIGEASIMFLPVSLLLFLVSWLGRTHIYPWMANHAMIAGTPVKEFWLRDGFLYLRVAFGLLLLFTMSFFWVYHGVRQDVADGKERLPLRYRPLYDRLTATWHPEEGFVRSGETRATMGPILIILYAVVMSVVAFDTIMSLSPHWVSNLLGGFFFMGAWLSGLMMLALLVILWRRHYGLEDVITSKHMHDLGKLCFGFTVFWMYTFFSQFIVIWYGNMPEETHFLFLRMTRPEWKTISIVMVVMCWLIPFFGLISVKGKKTPSLLGTFAVISLIGLWIDRFVLTVPSITPAPGYLPLGIQEILITAGFFGTWGLCYLWFAQRFPLVSSVLIRQHGERRKHAHHSDA